MKFEKYNQANCVVVKLNIKGATLSDSEEFKKYLTGIYEEGNHNLIIDCKNVEYMDSSFLVVLVIFLKRCVSNNGDLKIIRTRKEKPIWHMFEITRLDNIFNSFYSVEKAAESFK